MALLEANTRRFSLNAQCSLTDEAGEHARLRLMRTCLAWAAAWREMTCHRRYDHRWIVGIVGTDNGRIEPSHYGSSNASFWCWQRQHRLRIKRNKNHRNCSCAIASIDDLICAVTGWKDRGTDRSMVDCCMNTWICRCSFIRSFTLSWYVCTCKPYEQVLSSHRTYACGDTLWSNLFWARFAVNDSLILRFICWLIHLAHQSIICWLSSESIDRRWTWMNFQTLLHQQLPPFNQSMMMLSMQRMKLPIPWSRMIGHGWTMNQSMNHSRLVYAVDALMLHQWFIKQWSHINTISFSFMMIVRRTRTTDC